MAKTKIATAYVEIIPDMTGAAKTIRNGIVYGAGTAGTKAGKTAGVAIAGGLTVAKIAIGNALANVFSYAASSIGSVLSDAFARVDTLNTFPKIMEQMGFSTQVVEESLAKITTYVNQEIPATLDGVTDLVKRLTSATGNLEEATDIGIAFSNMMLASAASTSDQSRALTQYSQMLSKGKVDQMAWNTLMEVMPTQMDMVAKAMLGAEGNGQKLYESLQSGEKTFEDFNAAIIKLNEEGYNGLASFAEQALTASKTIANGVSVIRTNFVKGFANIIDSIGQENIANFLYETAYKIRDFFNWIGPYIEGGIQHLTDIYKAIQPDLQALKPVLEGIFGAIFKIAGVLADVVELVAKSGQLIPLIATLLVSKKLGILSAAFTSLKSVLFGTITSITQYIPKLNAAGTAAEKSSKKMSKASKGLSSGMTGFLAAGVAIALIAAGFALLAYAAIQLAAAGWPAIAVMAGMVIAIGALVAIFSIFGAGLDAASVGLIAFGAAILLAGAGIAIAAIGIAKLADRFPVIAEYGLQVAANLGLVSLAMTGMGAACLVAAAGLVTFGGSLIVATASFVAFSAACIAAFATSIVFTVGLVALNIALLAVVVQMGLIASSASDSAESMKDMVSSISIVQAGLDTIAAVASSAIGAVVDAFKSLGTSAPQAAQSACDKTVTTINNYKSKFYDSGKNLAEGLANGIENNMWKVTNAVDKIVSEADRALRAKAQIKSPSRLFAKEGEYISLGLAKGIEDAGTKPVQAMEANIKSISDMQVYATTETTSNDQIADAIMFLYENLGEVISKYSPNAIGATNAYLTELSRKAVM